VNAIFADTDVPSEWEKFTGINARFYQK